VRSAMGRLRLKLDEAQEGRKVTPKGNIGPRFAPAGQSTQMIVGADAANDQTILTTSANLYGSYKLRRIYYSAFTRSPMPAVRCLCWRRRWCASTGFIRPTG
jgi:predicted DNA-binding helix-hairpin-helix protein